MQPHEPRNQTTDSLNHQICLFWALLSVWFYISLPRVCGACTEQEGASTTENMGMEEIPLLLQRILNPSSRERRAEWMQAVLEGCFACQLPPLPSPGTLNFSKAWPDAHYHFKISSVSVCSDLGIHSTDFSLKHSLCYSLHIHSGSSNEWEGQVHLVWPWV